VLIALHTSFDALKVIAGQQKQLWPVCTESSLLGIAVVNFIKNIFN